VKLFQIEEPEGGPADPSTPGAAIGIDAAGPEARVAFSVGGNAVVLTDREGFERRIPVPTVNAANGAWQELLEALKVRADRALARPVSHAVIVLAGALEPGTAGTLYHAASEAGLEVSRLVSNLDLPVGSDPALAAAMLAEDLAPRAS
jgi:hypothetical protein